jgi:hypothetical protein
MGFATFPARCLRGVRRPRLGCRPGARRPRFGRFSGVRRPRVRTRLPKWRLHPSKLFPSRQPLRVTAAVALSPLRPLSAHFPSVQARPSGEVPAFARPQGFAPSRSPLQRLVLPPDPARCSLGLSIHRMRLAAPRRPGPEGPRRRCRSQAARRLSSCGAGSTLCCPAAPLPEGSCTADPRSAHVLRRARALPAARSHLLRIARRRREAGSRLRALPRARSAPEGTRAARFAARCAVSRRGRPAKSPPPTRCSNHCPVQSTASCEAPPRASPEVRCAAARPGPDR